MAAANVRIPDDVVHALRLPPGEIEAELAKELAVSLYARGVLSLGKARRLAGMTLWEFEDLLGKRQVPRHYGQDDLAEDLAYAAGDQ